MAYCQENMTGDAEKRLNVAIEEYGYRISPRQSFKERLRRFLELESINYYRPRLAKIASQRGWHIGSRLNFRDFMVQYMEYSENAQGRTISVDEILEAIDETIQERQNSIAKVILREHYGRLS